ncbi:MAG: serine protease [Thermoanaerobaculia bacterium]|nr:serine protease [Thermoanaerobaculia bacterium]
MKWHQIHQLVSRHVFRVETQDGVGTGFLFGYNRDKSLAAVATAAHVVSHAHHWRQPIRLVHHATSKEVFLGVTDRVIFLNARRDSASILVHAAALPFEVDTLELFNPTKYKRVGIDIAWMGFPSVAYPELCFFTGCISAFLGNEDCYLVDGVAINGVSGGPVFAAKDEKTPEIIGIVSAYLPNRTGNTPGLLRAQDISQFHQDLQLVHSFDDAKQKEKRAQQEAVAQGQQPSHPEPPPEPPAPSEPAA